MNTGHNKPCLLMLPCIDKFSSGDRHLTVSARNSAYCQSRHMHPRVWPGKLLLTSLTLISQLCHTRTKPDYQASFVHPISKSLRRCSSILWQKCTAIWDLNLGWQCPSSSRDSSHQECTQAVWPCVAAHRFWVQAQHTTCPSLAPHYSPHFNDFSW